MSQPIKFLRCFEYKGILIGAVDPETVIGIRIKDNKQVLVYKGYYDMPTTIYDYERIVDETFKEMRNMML